MTDKLKTVSKRIEGEEKKRVEEKPVGKDLTEGEAAEECAQQEKPVNEVIDSAEKVLKKAKAESNPIVKSETMEKKNPAAKAKKVEKKSEPKKYSSVKTQTYKTYTGTVHGIKRKDGKALRISYPVGFHLLVLELKDEQDIKISKVYAAAIDAYLKKNKKVSDGTIKPLEALAKEKKTTISKLTYFALKDFLLKHGKTLPNNNIKS